MIWCGGVNMPKKKEEKMNKKENKVYV